MFREAKTFQDKVAVGFVRFLRYAVRLLFITLVPPDQPYADGDLISFPDINIKRFHQIPP